MKKNVFNLPVLVAATALTAGLLFASKPANAQTPINPLLPTKNTKEISLSGNIQFDPSSYYNINVGYGYFFSPNLEVSGTFGYFDGDNTDSTYNVGAFVDYHFPGSSPLLPFVGVGIGFADPGGDSDTSFSYGARGGVKYFLNQNVSANALLQWQHTDDGSDDIFGLNFGLSVYLR